MPDAGPAGDAGHDAGGVACEGMPDGTPCGTGMVCVDGVCASPSCGDGAVDASEECDDGNGAPFDGCENDCTFTCHLDSECADPDPCNGAETCSPATHVCVEGTPLDDFDACSVSPLTDGECRAGECVPHGCGNGHPDTGEQCDDRNTMEGDGCENDCTFTCDVGTNCDIDNNVCNGIHTCYLTTHVCIPPEMPLDCDDGNRCTADACDGVDGCVSALIDGDGDLHPPNLLGACGSDCDDGNPDIYEGAPELCDTVDQDCDGDPAPAVTPTWYVDCDDDGFASPTASTMNQCDEPPPSPCGGGWTVRPPMGNTADCDDTRGDVRPGITEVAGDAANADEDCDGTVRCFVDEDMDGVRIDGTTMSADGDCNDPGEGYTSTPSGDCDDLDPAIRPGAAEISGDVGDVDENCDGAISCFADADQDGYRNDQSVASVDLFCDDPGEARIDLASGDCDDTSSAIHPGAVEIPGDAAGDDEDCDGSWLCFANIDLDPVRTDVTIVSADDDCADAGEAPASTASGDCDDATPTIYPGATEVVGDEIDQSCDGAESCFVDSDSDGFRPPGSASIPSADADCADAGEGAAAEPATDCNDTDASVSPADPELADNGSDDDCDGMHGCYYDADNDGFSRSDGAIRDDSVDSDCLDSGEGSASEPRNDCLDTDPSIGASSPEVADNGLDDDCDGFHGCYYDADNDGYSRSDGALRDDSTDADCADPGEGSMSEPRSDCDDMAATTNPAAPELGDNGADDDCDGSYGCFTDADSDGYRPVAGGTTVNDTSPNNSCADAGEGAAAEPTTDCNDADAAVSPGDPELGDNGRDDDCDGSYGCFPDADSDGYRPISGGSAVNDTSADNACTGTGEGAASEPETDCDDGNAGVSPGNAEVGDNGLDDDCDGRWGCFPDADSDGYRPTTGGTTVNDTSIDSDCSDSGEGRSTEPQTDCDDTNAAVSPGDAEVGDNGIDDDCDGLHGCFPDADSDGYRPTGAAGSVVNDTSSNSTCIGTGEGSASEPTTDCNDTNASISPGDPEVGDNGADDDCDGSYGCFTDADSDGYRPTTGGTTVNDTSTNNSCADAGEGASSEPTTDCNDGNASISPGDPEVGDNSVDDDCDGSYGCFPDADSDGYRPSTGGTTVNDTSANNSCADAGEGSASEPTTDCNDSNAAISPADPEVGDNGADDDCDGLYGCFPDADSDGYRPSSGGTTVNDTSPNNSCADAGEGRSTEPTTDCNDSSNSVNPGALELCDAVDQDCNGAPRNGCPGTADVTFDYYASGWNAGACVPAPSDSLGGACATLISGMDIWTAWNAWSADTGVFGFRSVCTTPTITQTVASPEYTYTLSSSGSSFGAIDGTTTATVLQARCPAGTYVIGVEGRQGCITDALGIQCAPINYVRSGPSWVARHGGRTVVGPAGGPGGSFFSQTCPDGYILTHLQARVVQSNVPDPPNSWPMIQAVQIVCQRLSYNPQ